uniref:Prolamin-like domain-containing protein n=2 Tax=Cucumis melo TaxID=3656 RepID=A0A9I9CU77_CUCME
MAYLSKLLILTCLLIFALSYMVESRPNPKVSLATRLNLESNASDCWGSLFQLEACSSEIITFFLNGKINLSPKCCQSVKIIQHKCWPTLLGSLGYTADEANVLAVYCDTTGNNHPTPPSTSLPPSIQPEVHAP